MDVTIIGFVLLAAGGALQLITAIAVTIRLRTRAETPRIDSGPQVALVRPVCGIENFIEEALLSSFQLTYPNLELIFCVDDENDPIVPVVRRLMASHANVNARLLIGRDRISANPKLNNMVKGWNAATSEWIIFSDSNVLLPPDYVETLRSRWRQDTGVVSTATIGTRPDGFAAELECAFLNTFQARWVLAADTVGLGFALGKTLMWRRETLKQVGGLQALAAEAAEDIASTKALRGTTLRPRLARRPIEQPIGRKSLAAVWRRQIRWARLRRAGLRATYIPEILSGSFVPLGIGIALTLAGALPAAALAAYFVVWYAAEAILAFTGGWPLSWRSPFAWLARDVLIPVVWTFGWIGNRFEWRGNAMTVEPPRDEASTITEAEAEIG